jgi:hypothetical protein
MARRSSYQNVSRLRRSLRRFPDELKGPIKRAMEHAGAELAREIADRAPVEEGDLKAAAHYQVSRDGLAVHAGYSKNRTGFKRKWRKGGFVALWQDFGAKQHPATPFIAPAFRAKLARNLDLIEAAVDAVIRAAQNYKKK